MALNNSNYDKMDKTLENIHNESVRMDKNEKVLLNQRFNSVLNQLIEKLREDSLFKQVYNRLGYTGSFYDGVRVGAATEYDLNLILKPKIQMEITKDRCKPGFVAIKMFDNTVDKWFKKNWEFDGYLYPVYVRRWLESVVSRTLENCGNRIQNCTIKSSKSGPAITLRVISGAFHSKEISIDLVPVLEFPSSQWPPINRKSKKTLNGTYDDSWFAVPKHPEHWRLSFPRQEQYILNDLGLLKYTLRLMKKLRDEFKLDKVASYYVKTLFLWELEKLGRDVWLKTKKGRLFMHMLIKFQEALEIGSIPFYWDPKCNLIDFIKQDYLRNGANRLNKFIKKIDQLVLLDSIVEIDRYLRHQLNSCEQDGFVMVDAPQRNGTNPPLAQQPETAATTCSLQ